MFKSWIYILSYVKLSILKVALKSWISVQIYIKLGAMEDRINFVIISIIQEPFVDLIWFLKC